MKIIGTGSALPKKVISNDDLAQIMDTSDEWIKSRTGIRKRHISTGETNAELSSRAASLALEAAGVSPEEIDLIIAATVTGDNVVPTLSCQVQAALGATNAVAFDIGAACSGFLFGLATADAYFKTGKYKKALVIGAEILSKIMNWQDRSTCVLFGDGAGAAVVSNEEGGLLSIVQGSDGAGGSVLACPNRGIVNPFIEEADHSKGYVSMEGQAVYKFAVRTVPKAINQVLDEAGYTVDDVDLFILHQANIRIIESVAKRLKQPMEKFPTNLEECGNISAGSVPILLDKVLRDGMIKPGNKVVLSGFGAGLTWGACLVEF